MKNWSKKVRNRNFRNVWKNELEWRFCHERNEGDPKGESSRSVAYNVLLGFWNRSWAPVTEPPCWPMKPPPLIACRLGCCWSSSTMWSYKPTILLVVLVHKPLVSFFNLIFKKEELELCSAFGFSFLGCVFFFFFSMASRIRGWDPVWFGE